MSVYHFKQKDYQVDLNRYPADFSPCHRRVLSARNILPEQLPKSLVDLIPVQQLTDAKKAAQLLLNALDTRQKIVIVGDYDADGATASALMLSVLKHLSANVDTIIPHRIDMGYGLSEKAADEAIKRRADWVLTVDNGIAATAGVAKLKSCDIGVIITDHHLPAANGLPAADVIVNPNRPDCSFPSKALAGVGVAFYLVLALRQIMRERDDKRLDNFSLESLLPLVAIGTVADVVSLDFNNRILVEQGLKRLRVGRCSQGLLALMEIANISPSRLCASDISFALAPRLNAAGRIADMRLGVDCLLANNPRLAMDYAIELDNLNRQRRVMENEMLAKAHCLMAEQNQAMDYCLCLFDKQWHEGLIGILASKLQSQQRKTTFIFTQTPDGLLKASGRAAASVNLIQALACFEQENPEVLVQYGGHEKAAGLLLPLTDFERFTKAMNTVIAKQLTGLAIEHCINTDGELLPYEMSLGNAEFLERLEPWGQDLPPPLFVNNFYIDKIREVSKNHAQLTLIEKQSGNVLAGIAFNHYRDYNQFLGSHCQIAYHLEVNYWQGKKALSLLVKHILKN